MSRAGTCISNRFRQVVGQDQLARAEDHGTLYCILQFAHVAGPIVSLQTEASFVGEAVNPFLTFATDLDQEMFREQWNVLGAITQRWHRKRHDVESVI